MMHLSAMHDPPNGLMHHGPLVVVMLRPHRLVQDCLRAEKRPIPERRITLLVDTGADCTAVDKSIPEEMGLTATGARNIIGVSGKADLFPEYLLSVGLTVRDEEGKEQDMEMHKRMACMTCGPGTEFSGVLGRDFLSTCRLWYDGPRGLFAIDFSDAVDA